MRHLFFILRPKTSLSGIRRDSTRHLFFILRPKTSLSEIRRDSTRHLFFILRPQYPFRYSQGTARLTWLSYYFYHALAKCCACGAPHLHPQLTRTRSPQSSRTLLLSYGVKIYVIPVHARVVTYFHYVSWCLPRLVSNQVGIWITLYDKVFLPYLLCSSLFYRYYIQFFALNALLQWLLNSLTICKDFLSLI